MTWPPSTHQDVETAVDTTTLTLPVSMAAAVTGWIEVQGF